MDFGPWTVIYNYTDTVSILTVCGSPVYSAGNFGYSPTTSNGSVTDRPWGNYGNNVTGTATCNVTVKNSLDETASTTFQIRQIRNACLYC